ncbi:filamentous hemagglutinin N-terminal domain-containing protein [Leptolyngbya sp. FACHB-261]|uniref:two-partner secretion domain-containing protein n=1 Tax=Leptolyngbya sp. FACHB-261 TaxID=2692806 RepID=UPI001688B524|nr:filamentous hemagglutinin N-terminal domain-containing protein [Leptolyngbya sp. FACHB-261]MBD2100351.1 filamentous hemagglutinin N-terminal domain-containing protein [Leptolyngbya sp. FACHB-261]
MNQGRLQAWFLTGSTLGALLFAQSMAAQVVPDNTLLGGERSQVTGNLNFQINGGARQGGNLFHSFRQFSVPTGGSAYFNNAPSITTIFTRVTGGLISNIDGLIRANGAANLFLLNPNGILFGPNARLNIGGSFVATTANSISFADNFQYSATNPQRTPLLTVSVPSGLQMGANPGPIVVQGNGYDLSVTVPIFSPLIRGGSGAGLQVPAAQTLALIGGDIAIDGGTLTAEQGRIELGSVRDGQVNLSSTTSGFAFDYQGSQRFGDIRLSQQALADASGGGLIQVQGNNVSLTDGSILLIQNQGTQAGGSVRVNAARSLEVSGSNADVEFRGLESETVGVGRGADITVSTQQLIVQNGAAAFARSHSSGDAGNITVNASDSVQLTGTSPTNPSVSSAISTIAFSSGDAGDVIVSTQEITVLDGGVIASPTFGVGRSGDITVNVLDSIRLIGQGNVSNPSTLAATTNSPGDAGQITVNTAKLVIQDGGSLSTSTLGTGRAGNITVNARESVEISGRPLTPGAPSAVRSAAAIAPEALRQAFGLPDRPSGSSGSLTINTPRLSISNGANATVSNEGTGSAGTLRVNADSIVIDCGSAITAATASGEGGNLDLNVKDVLLLRSNSQITTSAGGTGNGGNMRIDAGSIVAVPTENSDIRANSVSARGGSVLINTSGIFGIQFRSQDTTSSDITTTGASSAESGTVQLNINQLDPTSGLVELSTTVADPARFIAQGCPATQGNSFVITGRGGLPPTPEQQLDDDAEWQDRRRLTVASQTTGGEVRSQGSAVRSRKLDSPILEATGWQVSPTGEVILVAATPEPIVQNPLNQSGVCKGRQ